MIGKTLFNAHTWDRLTKSEARLFHNGKVLRCWHGNQHLSDIEICARLAVLLPVDQLRIMRLQYLGRVVSKADGKLWSLIYSNRGHPKSWHSLVVEDLQWMTDFLPYDHEILNGNASLSMYVRFLMSSPHQ